MREYLYRFLGTSEFRLLTDTYNVVEWVTHPDAKGYAMSTLPGGDGILAQIGVFPDTRLFHPDFQSKDFYRTNGALINELVRVGLGLAHAQPLEYGVANAGVLQPSHVEDVAKDLMDSARSGFRQAVRTLPTQDAQETPEQRAFRARLAERARVKQRNREKGAQRLRRPIPRQLLISGAYSDDVASDDEDLHGISLEEWRSQRAFKLADSPTNSVAPSPSDSKSQRCKSQSSRGFEALVPAWRNPALTRAYIAADKRASKLGRHGRDGSLGGSDAAPLSGDASFDATQAVPRRWRRDQPVVEEIPHALRGRRLPASVFKKEWLAQHRNELYAAPYYISVDDDPVPGWSDGAYADSESEQSGTDSPALNPLSDRPDGSQRSFSFSCSIPSSGRGSTEGSPASASVSTSKLGSSLGTLLRSRSRVIIDGRDTEFAVDDDDDEVDAFVPKMERRRSEKRRRTSSHRPLTALSDKPKPLAPLTQRSASAVGQADRTSPPLPRPLVGMVGRSASLPGSQTAPHEASSGSTSPDHHAPDHLTNLVGDLDGLTDIHLDTDLLSMHLSGFDTTLDTLSSSHPATGSGVGAPTPAPFALLDADSTDHADTKPALIPGPDPSSGPPTHAAPHPHPPSSALTTGPAPTPKPSQASSSSDLASHALNHQPL